MDNYVFYGVDRKTGLIVEMAAARGWIKVYRTPKKWYWQRQDDWNERAVESMRDQGLLVGFGLAAEVRLGMQTARDRNGKLYLLPPKREQVEYVAPHYVEVPA